MTPGTKYFNQKKSFKIQIPIRHVRGPLFNCLFRLNSSRCEVVKNLKNNFGALFKKIYTSMTSKTTIITMDETITVTDDDDSDNSIIELEIPRKPTPPLIEIEDEEMFLNISQGRAEPILARDFIEKDTGFLNMNADAESSQKTNNPYHWTSDMIKFYNDDWGGEDEFLVKKIQEKMDKSPSLWKVSRKDTEGVENQTMKVKCWHCGQRGHDYLDCPEDLLPKCYMCGNRGHGNFSCPFSKCLNCGYKTFKYVNGCFHCKNQERQTCDRCNVKGHDFLNCPDHWRMFHLTTGTTSVKIPEKNSEKPPKNMWCSNCGRKGHFHSLCRLKRKDSWFTRSIPYVVSYKAAFSYNQPDYEINELLGRKRKKKKNDHYELPKKLKINPMHQSVTKNTETFKKKFKKQVPPKKQRKQYDASFRQRIKFV